MKAKTNVPAGRLLGPLFEAPTQKADFAVHPANSRGRLIGEDESPTRTCYQRDRDRIIHAAAFRRLMHKTQVFFDVRGDYFRTRMTHSLEVAQIARSFARVLGLDEDLTEAVALAHDLGHTPFGHAGEEALESCTADIGGFDHNAHALRLLTKLEHRYAAFDGLNLTWETLEGLVKHNGPLRAGEKPIASPIVKFDAVWSLDLERWPSLEAQLAALADDIAYLNHDIDDGLRAGLFTLDALGEAPFVGEMVRRLRKRYGHLDLGRLIGELVRVLMGTMTADLLDETKQRLTAADPHSAVDIRNAGQAMAGFSEGTVLRSGALKQFLFYRMYRHPDVIRARERLKIVICELFSAYCADPSLMPKDWASACGVPRDGETCSIVRDYIAGMTDSFALQEYERIFGPEKIA